MVRPSRRPASPHITRLGTIPVSMRGERPRTSGVEYLGDCRTREPPPEVPSEAILCRTCGVRRGAAMSRTPWVGLIVYSNSIDFQRCSNAAEPQRFHGVEVRGHIRPIFFSELP